MKFICIAAMALLFCACHSKITAHSARYNEAPAFTDKSGMPMLLGIHTKEDLQQPPYQEWFNKNYSDYTVDAAAAGQLKSLLENKHFEIFMGTWCGDSKREVPRMLKLLEYAGVKSSQIKMIMVDNHDSSYKQSPAHEEKNKNIHRVPDLLVYDGENEINRIIESPVVSLEKDLLSIAGKNDYRPHYGGAFYLAGLTMRTSVAEITKDSAAITGKLKTMIANSNELNSLGHVWLIAGERDKALLAFQLNAALFPGDANVYNSLGDIYMKTGRKEHAKKYYQHVLTLQPSNENAAKMLAQLN